MYLVDSSTIVAAFRRSEPSHPESIKLLSLLRSSGFVITDHVLFEVGTILKFKEGVSVAQKALEVLSSNQDVEMVGLTPSELDEALEFFLLKKKLSLVDASLIVVARRRGYALVTQDKALLTAFKEY